MGSIQERNSAEASGNGLEAWGWRALAFTSLGHLINDGWSAFIPLIADIVTSEKQAPLLVVSLMSVGFYSTSALLSFFVGRWADRSGTFGKAMSMGIALFSLSMLGFYLTLQFPGPDTVSILAVLFSLMAGFASAFYHPLAGTILRTAFRASDRGKALGVNGAFGSIGSLVVPPGFLLLAVYVSEASATLILSLLGILAALTIWRGLREYKLAPAASADGTGASIRKTMTRGIVILAAISAVRTISNTGIYFWLPTYITHVRGEGIGLFLGLNLAIIFVGAIPGQVVFGIFIERFEKRYVLGFSSAGAALSILGYILSGGYPGLVFVGLFGFFTFSTFPVLVSLTSDYVSGSLSTAAIAFVWGLGATGGNVIGPALVGAMVGNTYSSLNTAFLVMVGLGVVGALVTPLMPKPSKKLEAEEVP